VRIFTAVDLPAPFGPRKAEDRSLLDLEAEPVECSDPTSVRLLQVRCFDGLHVASAVSFDGRKVLAQRLFD
jgi:hypothetical protein